MVEINQWQGLPLDNGDPPVNFTSWVPNCIFSGIRQSGIYSAEEVLEEAEILEFAFTIDGYLEPEGYGLLRNGDFASLVILTPEDKKLARDRDDLRKGRVVQGVEGVQYGNFFIPFASTVIASGANLYKVRDPPWKFKRLYSLVAEVRGSCPPLASGRSISGLECLVLVSLFCDEFVEDFEIYAGSHSEANSSTNCEVEDTFLIWGKNFVADSKLAAAVAGVYSVIQPHPYVP